ncbi:MAG: hypothetical protein J1E42_03290 [Akkermansiaceae bacterium]|nr:hypothetical protein [Akkermansiaceae bacterium]
MRKKKHLTIDEKRDWLACVFRDTSGEYSQADKFKAMAEDTRLAMLQDEQQDAPQAAASALPELSLLSHLPPPLAPPADAEKS